MSGLALIKRILATKPTQSLGLKLIIAIGVWIALGSLVFWYSIMNTGMEETFKTTVANASTTVKLVKKSVYHSMLTNNTDAVQRILESVASEENIKGIHVYSKKGTVMFSSDRAAIRSVTPHQSGSCTLCHEKDLARPVDANPGPKWSVQPSRDGRVLKSAVPIFNERPCFTAPCHYHREQQKVLGVLEMDYSLRHFDADAKRQNIATATFGIMFTVCTSGVLWFILWVLVIRPLTTLNDGMKDVAKGNLDRQVAVTTEDEIGNLTEAFNAMTLEIKSSRERFEHWTRELEEEVRKKTEEIRRGQEQFVHTEKLASLGRMAAGVAHELNSPLTGIVTFAHLILKRLPPDSRMDREDIEVIIEQAERCSKIIKGLLGFSRAIPSEKNDVSLNDTLRHAVSIIQNQAKFHNIKISLNLAQALPHVKGDSSQIEQVFLNLFINAADAMNDRGNISIKTIRTIVDGKSFVETEFSDTGPGIPEEHLTKIFEPFFTTKPVGKGTGLGLAVSHGIIKKHGGHIIIKSSPGAGATFLVRLPAYTPPLDGPLREGMSENVP